jgi:transposase
MPKDSKHDKVISALLETQSVREASIRCGVSEPTIYRYLNDPVFSKRYKSARRSIMEQTISRLQKATGEAVTTLLRNLNCENPSVEVRTAQIVLEAAQKGLDATELIERIEFLEKELNEKT